MECAVFLLILAVGATAAVIWLGRRPQAASPSGTSLSIAPPSVPPSVAPVPRTVRRPDAGADRFWVPAGQTVKVAGRDLGGMLYVGSGLAPVSDRSRLAYSSRDPVEPALVDPRLPVARANPDREGRRMTYWPSYSGIDPACRAAYLDWLAGGRKDPAAYIGYVFLFFYGIERRVLVDAKTSDRARAEVDALTAEVERLLAIYGENRSFRGYAGTFLQVARLLHKPIDPAGLEPPRVRDGFQVPLGVRIALGAFAAEKRPVPPEWAYAWAVTSPEVRLRTPAQRCPDEFEELFKIRYLESCRGGLQVRPGRATIAAEYQPASPSFFGTVSLSLASLPDVAGLPAPVRKLQEVVDQVTQELDVYSRWVGRTGDGRGLAAVSLLPPELARGRQGEEVRGFVDWIEGRLAGGGSAAVPAADLIGRWPCQAEGKLARRDAEMLAAFLEHRGYGIEPDVRFGASLPGSRAVLFRLPAEPGAGEPGPAYHSAAVLLHLAVALAAADGAVSEREEQHLLAHLESALDLSPAERARLEAHLRWLVAAPPGLAGLKKRIEPLAEPQRQRIGQFLVTVAGADGQIGAEELKLLTRVYTLLGLDPQTVYSDVHSLASGEAPAAEPVTVRPAEAGPGGFAIPPAPAPAGAGIALDLSKVRSKLAETEEIAGVLEGIFREEEPVALTPARPAAPGTREPSGPPPVAGLDGAHSAFLRRLAERPAWERAEVERLAAGLGLLPDGALEVLNEAAFERCGIPLLEGEETLEIDNQVLQEMLA